MKSKRGGALLSAVIIIAIVASLVTLANKGVFDDFLLKISSQAVFDSSSLNDGLISHYSFEGSAYDSIRKEKSPVDESIEMVDGRVGQSYYFIGDEEMIGIGKPEELLGSSVTWAGWAKAPEDASSAGRTLYERGGIDRGYQIHLGTSGKFSLRYRWAEGDIGYSTCTSSKAVNDGKWHFVTAVINADEQKMMLYIDGSEECEQGIEMISKRVDQSAHIGSYGSAAVHLEGDWKGAIDEVSIWSRALSEDEVQELYLSYPEEPADEGEAEPEDRLDELIGKVECKEKSYNWLQKIVC